MKHAKEFKERRAAELQGAGNHFHGKKHTPESIEQMSENRKGQCLGADNHNYGKPRRLGVRRQISRTRVRLGVARREKNPNWRGGITSSRKAAMATTVYKEWRKAVFERDNFVCQMPGCGKRGGDLEADHIKPWAYFPELRYEISNGRTLCVVCHRTTFKDVFKWRDISR